MSDYLTMNSSLTSSFVLKRLTVTHFDGYQSSAPWERVDGVKRNCCFTEPIEITHVRKMRMGNIL